MGRYWKLAIAGAGIAAGAVGYATLIEPRTILLREIDLALPTLPPSLDGLSIAFLSDFHLGGPGDPLGSANRALSVLQEQKPDLILLGGDYYDRGKRVPEEPDWARFPAIAPTFAVPGNHDYHLDRRTTEEIMECLSTSGIRVLRNETVDHETSGGQVRLIGLDDPYSGFSDYQRATSQNGVDIHPTILLAHAGLVADHLPVASADLIVSGHTHGAQIRFSPFRHTTALDIFWWLDFIKNSPLSPYRQGVFRVRGSLLYVGNGLGTTTLGIRLMAPPEIAIFRLRSRPGNSVYACDDPRYSVLRNETTRLSPLADAD